MQFLTQKVREFIGRVRYTLELAKQKKVTGDTFLTQQPKFKVIVPKSYSLDPTAVDRWMRNFNVSSRVPRAPRK